MPQNPKTVRLNWTVYTECVDCGAIFRENNVDPSVERIGNARMIIVTVPNECPVCHNLRVVKEKTDAGT